MKSRKLTSLLMAALLVLTTVLTGCNNSDSGTSGSSSGTSSSSGKDTIVITYPDMDDKGENGPLYKWITQTYENWDKKDEVDIEIQPIVGTDSDYFTKVQIQMQDTSTSPDLFFEDTFQLNTDVAAGYVQDLTDYISEWDAWETDFIESLKEGTRGSDGLTYAVPVSTDVRGLWYNKDVFEEAGLGREWQPESWQDILDACAAIKENCADDVVPIWLPVSNTEAEATTMNSFLMFLAGTGETLVDESTEVWNVSGQGFLDSLEFIETLKTEGYIGTLSEVFDVHDWEYANEYMSTGKLGIFLNGSWGYADYVEDGTYPMEGYTDETLSEALGFAQMPTQDGGDYVTMSGGWSWAIAKNSDEKDLSFEFLTEMMQRDNYITYLVGSGNLSTLSGMMEYEDYQAKLYVEEATAMSENAQFRPHNENYSKISSYIYEMVDTIVRNGTDIDTAMADFKTSVITVVGQDKVS